MNYRKLVSIAKNFYPNLRLRYKEDSRLWRMMPKGARESLSAFLGVIWLPSRRWVDCVGDFWAGVSICHELRHIDDQQKDKFFNVKYLFPQILAAFFFVFGIAALLLSSLKIAILAGVFLLALLPWPAVMRANYELSAYAINCWMGIAKEGGINEKVENQLFNWIYPAYRGSLYYKMVWRKKTAAKYANKAISLGLKYYNGELEPYQSSDLTFLVKRWLEKELQN